MYIHIIPGKNKFNNDGSQKITLAVNEIFSFDFRLVFAISRLFVVSGPITTATSCQDADFFPAMIYTYIYIYIYRYRERESAREREKD